MTAPSPDVSMIFEILKAIIAIALIPLEIASFLSALSMDIRDNFTGALDGVSDGLWTKYDQTVSHIMDVAESLNLVRSEDHSTKGA